MVYSVKNNGYPGKEAEVHKVRVRGNTILRPLCKTKWKHCMQKVKTQLQNFIKTKKQVAVKRSQVVLKAQQLQRERVWQ